MIVQISSHYGSRRCLSCIGWAQLTDRKGPVELERPSFKWGKTMFWLLDVRNVWRWANPNLFWVPGAKVLVDHMSIHFLVLQSLESWHVVLESHLCHSLCVKIHNFQEYPVSRKRLPIKGMKSLSTTLCYHILGYYWVPTFLEPFGAPWGTLRIQLATGQIPCVTTLAEGTGKP